ncbi:MAG: sulfide-dependent adenosine diphosphate thiazole synthase [Brevinematia bacterium]
MQEILISKAIIDNYTKKLLDSLENDVIIAGAGPSGLVAAYYLSRAGFKTLIIERKLSTGGGIWGGASGYNVITIENEAVEIIEELGIKKEKYEKLFVVDAVEFATGLAYKAIQAGAKVLNLTSVEDIIFKNNSVQGVVVNGTAITLSKLHVDPFCIKSRCVVDATGHPAEIVAVLKKKVKNIPAGEILEGPMDVETSEKGVVERTGEFFPGLYLTGMSVCSVYGLPRMGPIFGGMLLSGRKVAEIIKEMV